MDYLRQHGALVLDHRFRRLTEYLLKAAEETYQALELPFRARWASTYLLLEESGPLGITEIAAGLKLTHPGIIGITDEMRGAGIVTFVKDRKDARRRTVTLTPKGRSLAARLHAVWAALESAQRQRFAAAGCDIVPVVNSVEDGLSARPLTAEVVARVARGRRGKAPVAAVAGMLLLLASASRPALSQSPSQPPPSVRSSLVQAIADSLINGYIYEDRARAMTDSLRAALSRGVFDAAPDRGTLARTIGEFLQRISLDRHLSVSFDAAAPAPAAAPGPQRVRRPSAAGNDGFGRSEILPGHIGYLELFGFSGDPTALQKADSVMSAFAGVSALIIDVRQNTGGGPEMVRRLSTWLFDKPTHLVNTFARGMDQPSERWTQDPVPGNRLTAVPVYILTSRRTFSAAESFTFGLKAAGRVTIVGERTGGGGHFGRFIPLIDGFSMFLPVGRTYDPRTGQGWEAEGIAPDVAVPQEQALEKALGLARGTDSALPAVAGGNVRQVNPMESTSMKPIVLCAAMVLAAANVCVAQVDSVSLFGPGVISRPDSNESFGSLAPNGREFYYTIHRSDFGGHRIVVSRLDGGRWSAPQTLPFSGTWNDREPKVSPDGRRLYFSSNRPVMTGDTARRRDLDLWMAERGAGGVWGSARHIEAPVNTSAQEFCPVVVANGTLYFIATRPGGVRGPEPGNLHNVWRARPLDRSGLRFSQPENLGAAINGGFETNVYVSPDERTMLVSRDGAPDGLGGDDLYVSTFVDGAWQQMRHLPAPVNSDKYEFGPSISPDGKWVFFTSARAGAPDIYRVPIAAIEREGVRRTVLDYLEGFYEGDTAKLVRSLRPELFKFGFWREKDSTTYVGEKMTYAEALSYAARFRAQNRTTPADAPREVILLDVQDQTASAKVRAWWGTDYLLLAKYDGRWMILQVIWQGP